MNKQNIKNKLMKNHIKEEYTVILSSCGRIEIGQNPYKSLYGVEDRLYTSTNIPDLQIAVRNYIEEHGLGASTFSGGKVFNSKKQLIGRISYNGRYWEGEELKLEYPSKSIKRR